MARSVEQFLEEVAQRGSWLGGGSVVALSTALSAALLEKLIQDPGMSRRLRAIRQQCVDLIDEDAQTFAHVIEATRTHNRRTFTRALKRATEVPCRLFEHVQAMQQFARRTQRTIHPRLQSDVRCAIALAQAAGVGARTLINTNLTWLHDRPYTRSIQQRLQAATRTAAR